MSIRPADDHFCRQIAIMWRLTSTFEVLEQLPLDCRKVVVERRGGDPQPSGEARTRIRAVRKLREYP
jgi:hypothetical protein